MFDSVPYYIGSGYFCRRRQFTLRDYFAVSCLWLVNLDDVTKHVSFGRLWLVNFKNQFKKFCTPRSLSPTLYTPLQCTLPHTFTYRACPFSVHCLSFKALASWDLNPIPWYLETSVLSTTPPSHWCDYSKFGSIHTREWSRQNRFQGQIAVDSEIATAYYILGSGYFAVNRI